MKKTVLGMVIAVSLLLTSCGGSSSKYSSVDKAQAATDKYESIAEYMDEYLEAQGYFVMNDSVEWIGYSKYKDLFSEEEYEDYALGGYYSYTAELSTGELADGSISTYWGEGEEPVVVDLTIETYTSETTIVEYSDEKMSECWQVYQDKCSS